MYEDDEHRRARENIRPAGQGTDVPPPSAPYPTNADTVRREEPGAPLLHEYRTGVEEVAAGERVLELREEQLVARKDLRELGEVRVRTVVDDVPTRLEVEARREEVEVEHVPVNQVVHERVEPWEEDGVIVVPVYEEQLVVVKRLVLREHLRVRRVGAVQRQLFQDTVRRERLVIEDPNNTRLVHERYATDAEARDRPPEALPERREHETTANEDRGLLGNIRKALR